MKTIICILILFSTVSVFSQTVSYTYDASGNCLAARVVYPGGSFRSSDALQEPNESEAATALPEVITEKDFSIYPNPTHGHFTVEIHYLSHDMKGEVYLYDSNGRLVEEKKIHSHHLHTKLDFNLSHKSEGMYILNIHLGENTFTWKIIKK